MDRLNWRNLQCASVCGSSVPLSWFPAVRACQRSYPTSFWKSSSRSGSHSSWQTQTRRFLCMIWNPNHLGIFLLSLYLAILYHCTSGNKLNFLLCRSVWGSYFSQLGPPQRSACRSYFISWSLKSISGLFIYCYQHWAFALKPAWGICLHFCHELLRMLNIVIFLLFSYVHVRVRHTYSF